ncbi:NAD(P)-dependent oxidoreductase [Actinoplanes sp. NPDC051513]|uniref:NAD(P)-dependent oxidoreductase n=1 Tax=Actinoplanes sp. NPDC051513 TaxID=3363908 RepID=UPI00379DDC05
MSEGLNVAVLGAGIMGAAMAKNIAKAGHTVTVWNRSADKAAATGLPTAATPAEAVRHADVVLTMLFDGETVREVIEQAANALRPGTYWIQSTTSAPADVAKLAAAAAERGVIFFDAPVLGTRQPAEAGQLSVLAAGPEDYRAAVQPIFDAVGARTVWTGTDAADASATKLKLVANSWVLAVTHGAAETLALAKGLGVAPDAFFQLIEGGPLDMGYLHAKSQLILEDRLTPASFAVGTAEKDARLIVETGQDHGVRLDVAAAGAERFRRAGEQGHTDSDMAASYFASWD